MPKNPEWIDAANRIRELESALLQLLTADDTYMADDEQEYPYPVLDVIDEVIRPLMGAEVVRGRG